MGVGIDPGVEMVEEERVLRAFEHEEVGDTAGGDDGGGGRGVGVRVGEGGGGGGVAGEVFPVEGGEGGNAGEVPEAGGEFGGGEDDGRGGMGSGDDIRGGNGGADLGGEGAELEGAEIGGIRGESAEKGRKSGHVVPKAPTELEQKEGRGEESGEERMPERGRGSGNRGQEEERGGKGGEPFPAVLPKEKGEEHEEERKGKESPTGKRPPEERNRGDCGKERGEQKGGKRTGFDGGKGGEGKKFVNVAGVKAEHQRGAGNVPVGGPKEDQGREGSRSGDGEGEMGKEGGRKAPVLMPPACEAAEGFPDAEEGEGVEGMVGLEAHAEVVGGVFEEPEEEGGGKAGDSPKTPESRSDG